MGQEDDLLSEVANYYSSKLAAHGATPAGVDWNGEEGQLLRFERLAKVVQKQPCSVIDVGCGYGALLEYLSQRFEVDYTGVDVSASMVDAARERYPQGRFILNTEAQRTADYAIASGIFNVKLRRSEKEWEEYVKSTLDLLDRSGALGFAFNCLTSYSDPEKMRPDLYYADPSRLFDHCKRKYSKNVALLHDYGLYEFTIIVRKVIVS